MSSETYSINNENGLLMQNLMEHSVKRNEINSQVNDMINLKYNEKDNSQFELYDNYPKKLSFFNIFKFRNQIKNFIIFQYSKKADTFVERKLLKDTKMYCCKNMNIFPLKNFTFFFICSLIFSGHPLLLRYMIGFNIFWSYFYANKFWWIRYNNTILLNLQINSNYKLGKETKEFIYLIENNLLIDPRKNKENNKIGNIKYEKDEENNFLIVEDGKVLRKFSKDPSFYEKFFIDELVDLPFEKDDEIIDYLSMNINYDFHKEYLNKISQSNKMLVQDKDFMKMIK